MRFKKGGGHWGCWGGVCEDDVLMRGRNEYLNSKPGRQEMGEE